MEKIPSIPYIPSNNVTADGTPFVLVADAVGLEIVRDSLEETAVVGIDCETTSLSPRDGRVRLVSLTTDTVEGGMIVYVVDVAAVNPSPLWETLAERPVVAHNAVFDLQFLAGLGFAPGAAHCTMILSQLLHGTRKPKGFHGLKETAERELGTLLDKTEQRSDWSGALTEEQLAYAAADAAILPPLFTDLTAKLKAAGLSRVAEIEARCLPAVAWLCRSGVALDTEAWAVLAAEAKQKAEALAAKLAQAAPPMEGSLLGADGWNWDSPDQVREVFKALGVTLDSTDDDALAAIAHPLAGLVPEYRMPASWRLPRTTSTSSSRRTPSPACGASHARIRHGPFPHPWVRLPLVRPRDRGDVEQDRQADLLLLPGGLRRLRLSTWSATYAPS